MGYCKDPLISLPTRKDIFLRLWLLGKFDFHFNILHLSQISIDFSLLFLKFTKRVVFILSPLKCSLANNTIMFLVTKDITQFLWYNKENFTAMECCYYAFHLHEHFVASLVSFYSTEWNLHMAILYRKLYAFPCFLIKHKKTLNKDKIGNIL